MSGIKVIFGAAPLVSGRPLGEKATVENIFSTLKKHNVKNLDTARLYGDSETVLGSNNAGDSFIIDTKLKGGFGAPEDSKKENIIRDVPDSLKQLKVKQVDVFYIHAPQKDVDIHETLEGVNEAYKKGAFKRFGLSNFAASDVQKVYDISKEKGYVLPTVYQGNYSAVARKQEEVLFPTLRKLGISFYAYSPIAGGFLTKTKQDIQDQKGRFNSSTPVGNIYIKLYTKPSYLEALGQWADIAKDAGIDRAELAYRWVTFNSPLRKEQGDGIIVGASSVEQLEKTLQGLERGPLSDDIVKRIDQLWKGIEKDAPLDNYHDMQS